MLLEGGPMHTITPGISLVLTCQTQDEIDRYWDLLGKDGEYQPCGWLVDPYGVSWQVIPEVLGSLMNDPQRAPRVAQVMRNMMKFEIQPLLDA